MTTFFAGDVLTAAALNAVTDKPICQLFQTAAQTITDNTSTALTFTGTEDIDTHNFHDPATNPERITPTVPGYYLVTASYGTATPATMVTILLSILKNATIIKGARRPFTGTTTTSSQTIDTSIIVALNGSTDFVSATALQDNTGSASQATITGTVASSLSVEFIRPL